VKNVPAVVRVVCGEQYVDGDTARHLLATAKESARSGVEVEVRAYIPV